MNRFLLALSSIVLTSSVAWADPSDLFTDKVKDFGTTPRGPVLVHYFRFTNTTNQTLTLGQPRVSCGCTSASVTKSQVGPGESAAVIAYMDTRRINTPNVTKTVTVYVPFLAPVFTEVALRVQTVCRDDLLMTPYTLAFGTIQKGKEAKASTKVTFTSDPNWQVTESSSNGVFVKVDHKLESRNGSLVTYEITATLSKDCPAGNWVSEVTLKSSNAAVGQIAVPVTVTVNPAVAATPATVELGALNLGSATEKQITLKGGTAFRILEIKGLDEQLVIKADQTESKPEHVITLSATPKLAGAFSRSVEVVTDNPDQPRIVIPVVARVVGP